MRISTMWFPNWFYKNRAVQTQQMTGRDWEFWISDAEEWYYLCSENKGTDQLRSYCEADLRPWFLHMQNVVFLMMRLNSVGNKDFCSLIEPHREKTGFLPMRKQRRRSASR